MCVSVGFLEGEVDEWGVLSLLFDGVADTAFKKMKAESA